MKSTLSAACLAAIVSFASRRTLLALDFDGTLAPFTARPDGARMRRRTSTLLAAVSRRYPCVIVTGRARADLTRYVGHLPIEVIGNHGAEPADDGLDARPVIARARRRLAPLVRRRDGTWIEDKTYSLSLHYRDAADPVAAADVLRTAARRIPGVAIVPGKFALNIVARGASNKGHAVKRALSRYACTHVIYIGDDETDESVFRARWRDQLLGIRVGCDTPTRATFCLSGQRDVDGLLAALARLRRDARRETVMMSPEIGEPALGATLEFMRLLWALDHALQKRSKWMASHHGVTGPQRLALKLMSRMPDVSAGRLAETLKVHPSTLTGVLQRLETGGLIVRKADRSDRRRVRLELTPRGRKVTDASGGSIEDAVTKVIKRAGKAQMTSTAALLRSLVEALDPAKD